MANFGADHKLIWKEITPEEALKFISFLESEVERHKREVAFCQLTSDTMDNFSRSLWRTASLRHTLDIMETNKVISEVKEYFKL